MSSGMQVGLFTLNLQNATESALPVRLSTAPGTLPPSFLPLLKQIEALVLQHWLVPIPENYRANLDLHRGILLLVD